MNPFRCVYLSHEDDPGQLTAQELLESPEYHLRNLKKLGAQAFNVSFRKEPCEFAPTGCCGGCTRRNCSVRCPQDVINRAYLLCGNILWATEDEKEQRYQEAPFKVKMIYKELTSDQPRYFAIDSMVRECLTTDAQLDYSPQKVYEEYYDSKRNKWGIRPRVNPDTGELLLLHWPRSGMCPFCLPVVLADMRRYTP
jgi:hypothetical protein